MKSLKSFCFFGGMLFLLGSCHPAIYYFNSRPETISMNEPVRISWDVKGTATLLISDSPYDMDTGRLAPLTLLVKSHGTSTAYRLVPNGKLKIPVASTDSLEVAKQPDSVTDTRLRTFRLVATRNGADSSLTRQVAVLPDSAASEIGMRYTFRGDTLVARGENNPARWGSFVILSVKDASNRPLEVIHNNIRRLLLPDGHQDHSFKNTPVKGIWEFRTLKTAEEKANPRLFPHFLQLSITVKPH